MLGGGKAMGFMDENSGALLLRVDMMGRTNGHSRAIFVAEEPSTEMPLGLLLDLLEGREDKKHSPDHSVCGCCLLGGLCLISFCCSGAFNATHRGARPS